MYSNINVYFLYGKYFMNIELNITKEVWVGRYSFILNFFLSFCLSLSRSKGIEIVNFEFKLKKSRQF